MNIVYRITHLPRYKENNPPYYYIGSKYNWKGEGTYYGSSRHPVMKEAKPEDLLFEVIWESEDCSLQELLEKEKDFHLDLNVVYSEEYFNMAIANSTCFHPSSRQKAIASFKELAWSESPDGRLYKDVWAEKAKASRRMDEVREDGLTLRQRMSKHHLERLNRITDSGLPLSKEIGRKMKETNLVVGEDGLNGFQRQGKKLSAWLNSINPDTGLPYSKSRKTVGVPVKVLGMEFKTKGDACKFLKIEMPALDKLLNNGYHRKTRRKLYNLLGKEYVDSFNIELLGGYSSKEIEICGKTFVNRLFAREQLKAPHTAFDDFILRGIISKKIKECLIDYFGEKTYLKYYETP